MNKKQYIAHLRRQSGIRIYWALVQDNPNGYWLGFVQLRIIFSNPQ